MEKSGVLLGIALLAVMSGGFQSGPRRVKREDEEEKVEKTVVSLANLTEEDFWATCSMAYDLESVAKVWITFPIYPNGSYPLNINSCDWTFLGSKECVPVVECRSFDMRQLDPQCNDEYFLVTDGVGGEVRACGTGAELKLPLRVSKRVNDIYISLRTSKDTRFWRKYGGVMCGVSCEKDLPASVLKTVRPLPITSMRHSIHTCVCGQGGQGGQGAKSFGRVVGGMSARNGEFPWMVAMVKKGTRQIRCGGSLINDRYVLTASHCVFDVEGVLIDTSAIDLLMNAFLLDQTLQPVHENVTFGNDFSIQTPGWNLPKKTDADEGTVRRGASEIIPHPAYEASNPNFDYDVALIQLDRPVDLTGSKIKPICLPAMLEDPEEIVYKIATVSGWGLAYDKAGASTRLLQKATLPVHPQEDCEDLLSRRMSDRMLCAGRYTGRADACTGDSGGPLTIVKPLPDGGSYTEQIGIVSNGDGCAKRYQLGVYTRVTDLVQWIAALASDGRWCRDNVARDY